MISFTASKILALGPVLCAFLGFFDQFRTSPAHNRYHHVPALSVLPDGSRDSVLVIDVSTSMMETDWKPSRLAAAKQAAIAFIQRLHREEQASRVAIVVYGDNAQTICKLTPVTQLDILLNAVNGITVFGCTNITAGLQHAFQQFRDSRVSCQVVLLSDGHHNIGTRPYKVADELKKFAIIETVGIGGKPSRVDERLLKDIASPNPDGSKRYRWIGDKERLVKHFHDLAGRITRA